MTKFEQNIKEKTFICDLLSDIQRRFEYGYEYAKRQIDDGFDEEGYNLAKVNAYEKIFNALDKLI